jgi:hypothetical protein
MLSDLGFCLLTHLQLVLKQLVGVFRFLVDVADVEELVARGNLVEIRLRTLWAIACIRLNHLFLILIVPLRKILI